MKNPYHKNKGKVHPSPSSSSSSSNSLTTSTNAKDALSVLNLLPVAILALASTLSVEDREVIAYLVTRSLNTSNPASIIEDKKKCKKSSSSNPNSNCSSNNKSQPIFDCGCFNCYTSYWFRWDSSPNRELIHQAIEAFEEHLTNGEKFSMMTKNSRGGGGGKKRDKMSRRSSKQEKKTQLPPPAVVPETAPPVVSELLAVAVVVPETEVAPMVVTEYSQDEHHNQKAEVDGQLTQAMTTAVQLVPSSNHKGMARKLLPDVMGLFNSRIWNLWSPNI